MWENIYNININQFTVQGLPMKRRTTVPVQWLMCLVSPLIELHTKFMQYRDRTNYKLDHTAQVFSLEDVLNDAFDVVLRRIYIADGEYTLPVWFYDRADDKPVFFYDRPDDAPVLFYDRKSLEKLDVDFTVILPTGLNLPEAEMIRLRALVDFYRLPDKTYTVTYG